MASPKFVGGDCELQTSGETRDGAVLDPWQATQRVLARVDALFESRAGRVWSRRAAAASGPAWQNWADTGSPHSTDCLRQWASNGQAFYSDMAHVEFCTAETLDARRHAAGALAALRVVEAARREAEQAGDGVKLTLSTHNADWLDPSISSGTHFNVSIERATWDGLFRDVRHPAVLGAVASGMAAAIVFFGGGYLLPFNDGTTIYSLSARAHHLSKLISHSTTEAFNRGILNARDEAHAQESARMHLIGFDLAPASLTLRGVFTQCLLAAAEEGFCGLNLFDPVRALRAWSWGLDLRSGRILSEALLVDGRRLTLPKYVRELAGLLLKMVEQGLIPDSLAPGAGELLPRVIELASRAESGELGACARHLDWAAKLLVMVRLCDEPGVRLGDPVTRLADQDYGNTDPDRGWFWRLWDDGAVDPLVTPDQVAESLDDGPAESRAWGRGRLIRHLPAEVIGDVNWSHMELIRSPGRWSPRLKIEMPQLNSLNRQQFETIISAVGGVEDLERRLSGQGLGIAARSDPLMNVESSLR